jgi:hypothetical protein
MELGVMIKIYKTISRFNNKPYKDIIDLYNLVQRLNILMKFDNCLLLDILDVLDDAIEAQRYSNATHKKMCAKNRKRMKDKNMEIEKLNAAIRTFKKNIAEPSLSLPSMACRIVIRKIQL